MSVDSSLQREQDASTGLAAQELEVARKERVLLVLFVVFVSALLISSVTASKVWEARLFGLVIGVPVGTSLFALTFLSTDVIAEVWGVRYARYAVMLGLLARVLMLVFFTFAVWIPSAPYWENQDAYESVLGLAGSGRIIIAGIFAYLVSQFSDVFIFHTLKERDFGRNFLWKRNLISTGISQFLDSSIFILIAFLNVLTAQQIAAAILGQLLVKWLIAVLDTPFVYLIRNYALGREWRDLRG